MCESWRWARPGQTSMKGGRCDQGVIKGELVSISVIWNLVSKPGGPKPAWIYRDTGEILVSQFKVT